MDKDFYSNVQASPGYLQGLTKAFLNGEADMPQWQLESIQDALKAKAQEKSDYVRGLRSDLNNTLEQWASANEVNDIELADQLNEQAITLQAQIDQIQRKKVLPDAQEQFIKAEVFTLTSKD